MPLSEESKKVLQSKLDIYNESLVYLKDKKETFKKELKDTEDRIYDLQYKINQLTEDIEEEN